MCVVLIGNIGKKSVKFKALEDALYIRVEDEKGQRRVNNFFL